MGVLELISGAETDYEFTLLQLILLRIHLPAAGGWGIYG